MDVLQDDLDLGLRSLGDLQRMENGHLLIFLTLLTVLSWNLYHNLLYQNEKTLAWNII